MLTIKVRTHFAVPQQRRGLSKFQVDTRFKKSKGAIHAVFKTKAQIEEMEKKRQAAEWNEWDLESMVRYKSILEYNKTHNPEETKTKEELRMRMRYYATDLEFRGGLPRPMEHTISKALQRVSDIRFYDHIQDGDLCTLDVGLMLKHVELGTIPPPPTLYSMLDSRHHVLDDYSCGHLFRYFHMILSRLLETPHKDGVLLLYNEALEVLRKMKKSQQGHRCTISSFTYSQIIRLCGAVGKLDDALTLKFEAFEKGIPITSQMYEGILEAANKSDRHDITLKEWSEIINDNRLYPTHNCCLHMLDACTSDFETATTVFNYIEEKNAEAYTKLISCSDCPDKAFDLLYQFLGQGDDRPTLGMCNALLSKSKTHEEAEAVLTILKERVCESNEDTFKQLYRISLDTSTTVSQLDSYWDRMIDARVTPSASTLGVYLQALVELPSSSHPVELLGKGLAAYDFCARKGFYNSSTFIHLFNLCARAGQFRVSKLLLKKMIFTHMELNDQHIVGVMHSLATTSSVPKFADELQHLLEIPLTGGMHSLDTIDVVKTILQLRSSEFDDSAKSRVWSTVALVTSSCPESSDYLKNNKDDPPQLAE
eukprot:TRINITY_DN14530_c0_g1_i1.p1 TRINITY_DN14530_c0_g1~~TRINITY_DN14530_c0_g1_i1.p1  ORF type:complete len:595 (+),score=93.88 TRINITY_DN14530_c0_g1_i1:51-1835(+)